MPGTPMLILMLALAAAGAALLMLGLRGRRVNNHPHCRRCQFDLQGVDAAAEGARCPECGAALDQPKAIRIGARRRRPRFIGFGAVMLLIAIGFGAALALPAALVFNWNPYKPQWMLETEVRDIGSARGIAAAEELANRASLGSLNAERHARLASRGVEAFVGGELPSQPMRVTWGDIVESAWERELIGSEALRNYIQSRMIMSLTPNGEVRSGDPVPVNIEVYCTEGGENQIGMLVGVRLDRVTLGGAPLSFAGAGKEPVGMMTKPGNHNSGSMARMTLDTEIAPSPGESEFIAEYVIELYTGFTQPWGTSAYFAQPEPPVAAWTGRIERSVRIVDADADNLEVIMGDDEDTAALLASIRVTRAVATRTDDGVSLSCSLLLDNLPQPVAGEILWRIGDREWLLGSIAASVAPGMRSYGFGAVVKKDFDADVVDVVIRPDPDAARRNVNMPRYWGSEIVIQGVEVTHDSP